MLSSTHPSNAAHNEEHCEVVCLLLKCRFGAN